MAAAARRAPEPGGGIVAVAGGRTALELPLPIGGIMAADRGIWDVRRNKVLVPRQDL